MRGAEKEAKTSMDAAWLVSQLAMMSYGITVCGFHAHSAFDLCVTVLFAQLLDNSKGARPRARHLCFHSITLVWGHAIMASNGGVWKLSGRTAFERVTNSVEWSASGMGAFYCFGFMSLAAESLYTTLWRERNKDYTAMQIHHLVTATLMATCCALGLPEYGIAIVHVHGATDVLMDSSKLLHHLKFDRAASVVYALTVAWWAHDRLWKYPQMVWAIAAAGPPPQMRTFPQATAELVFWGSVALLCTLAALHFYWFRMMLRILRDVVDKGVAEAHAKNYGRAD